MMAANDVFNLIKIVYDIKNDAALSRALEMRACNISKLRAKKTAFGPEMILRVHDKTGWPISQIKALVRK